MEYDVVFRDIQYPRIELKTGKPVLVLPEGDNPQRVLARHKEWLERKLAIIRECLEVAKGMQPIRRDLQEFKSLVHAILAKLAQETGKSFQQVFFRRMNSKWASVSFRENLTVNMLLSYLPEDLIEYVLFHELMHLRERRHNGDFFRLISLRYPDYEKREQELLTWWFVVQRDAMGLVVRKKPEK
jgi:hypothetical protein